MEEDIKSRMTTFVYKKFIVYLSNFDIGSFLCSLSILVFRKFLNVLIILIGFFNILIFLSFLGLID